MPYLLLLFIVMPIVEIAMFIQVGGQIGLLATLAIVVLTAVIGTAMLQRQGRATLERARERLGSGEMPAQEIVEGMLLLVGGVLLLTPGFVTDAFGFACLIPASRRWLAKKLSARTIGVVMGGRVGTGAAGQGFPPGANGPGHGSAEARGAGEGTGERVREAAPRPARKGADNGDVIEGDYRRID